MHYRLGYNVAVFDADFPQHNLMKMKTRDLAEADSKTVFRSTLMPPDERLMKACQLDLFISEFLNIIQL